MSIKINIYRLSIISMIAYFKYLLNKKNKKKKQWYVLFKICENNIYKFIYMYVYIMLRGKRTIVNGCMFSSYVMTYLLTCLALLELF